MVARGRNSITLTEAATRLDLSAKSIEALSRKGMLVADGPERLTIDSIAAFEVHRAREKLARKERVLARIEAEKLTAPAAKPARPVQRGPRKPGPARVAPKKTAATWTTGTGRTVPNKTLTARTASEDKKKRTVFIVHGRDEAMENKVARLLERCCRNLDVTILHEQVWQGSTVIEKFEKHGSVADYAVVLATPDDEGKLAGAATWKPRARQNVILELGYFVGLLGRSRVALLRSGDVELPSDVLGVGYTDVDPAGAWKVALLKELSKAGFGVDLNKLN